MKKILVIAALTLALPAYAGTYLGNSDWTQPYATDQYTMALWHFNEVSGDTLVVDATGNNADGTLVPHTGWGLSDTLTWATSTVPYSGFGNMVNSWWNSNEDANYGGIEVLGTGDSTTDGLYAGPGQDLTIEWWGKAQFTNYRWAMEKTNGIDYMAGWYEGTENIQLTWQSSTHLPSAWTTALSDISNDGDWHHYAICVDRTSYVGPFPWSDDMDIITFFKDGVQVGLAIENNAQDYTNVGNAYLLDNAGGYHANVGDVDEMRISSVIRFIPEPSMLSLLAIALGARVLRRKK